MITIISRNITDGWYCVQGMEGVTYDKIHVDIPLRIEYKFGSERDFWRRNSVNLMITYCQYQRDDEQQLTDLLFCLDVFERINFLFPDPKTTVFDPKVVDHIKIRVPGMFCMVHVIHDEAGFPKINAVGNVRMDANTLKRLEVNHDLHTYQSDRLGHSLRQGQQAHEKA